MVDPRPDADPVDVAAGVLGESRGLRLVRRFEHGAGGTSLVEVAGVRLVLKAWNSSSVLSSHLPGVLARMATMRDRGVPVPEVVERGVAQGVDYLLYEQLPGRWPRVVTPSVLADLVAVVDAEREAAATPTDESGVLQRMLTAGDPLSDLHPTAVATHPVGRLLLEEARARVDRCDPSELRGRDIVHGDFAPENVLVDRNRVTGVVDWERCRTGDAAFDLVGALYDIELGAKADKQVGQQFARAVRARVPDEVLDVYLAIYAVRYASWAIGSPMEDEVLAHAARLVDYRRTADE